MTAVVLVAFVALQIAIGVWASRRISSEADFFVAGRRLGLPLLTMSIFATWFGAETCLGSSGAIYERGLSGGRADPLGYALCLLLLGLFLAVRLARGRFLTLGDLYRERYGVGVERLAVLLLVPSSLIWGAAQVRAFGEVLAHVSALPVTLAVVLSGVIVVAYTFLGGLWGDVVTDLIQGVFLCLSLVGLLVAVLLAWPEAAELDGALSPARLELFPSSESVWIQLDRFSVPVLGSLVTQELTARILGARTPSIARKGALLAAALYFLVGCIPVALGLLGPALLPGLTQPERLLPALAALYFPPLLALLFSCALLAVILSTVDSVLLSNAALLSHNLLIPWLGWETQRQRLWLGRIVLVLAGAFALGVALSAEGIYSLVELASSAGTAGLLVVTVAALFLSRHEPKAAFGALVVGALSTPLARAWDVPAPFLLSVGLAVVTFASFHTFACFHTGRGS